MWFWYFCGVHAHRHPFFFQAKDIPSFAWKHFPPQSFFLCFSCHSFVLVADVKSNLDLLPFFPPSCPLSFFPPLLHSLQPAFPPHLSVTTAVQVGDPTSSAQFLWVKPDDHPKPCHPLASMLLVEFLLYLHLLYPLLFTPLHCVLFLRLWLYLPFLFNNISAFEVYNQFLYSDAPTITLPALTFLWAPDCIAIWFSNSKISQNCAILGIVCIPSLESKFFRNKDVCLYYYCALST